MLFRKKVLSILVPVAAMGGMSTPVAAQDEAQFLEEVIVTARKKSESLQDIPLSVSAFSGEQIARRAYRDLRDIAMATSGLEYEDFATGGLSTAPVIRGMGQTFTTSRVQNTGVFLDGIYLQRQSMVNPGLLDVERIEVLKGPQNAQYGRNAFAGAINYITKKPPHEFAGEIGGTLGDGERRDLFGNVGGPIIPDVLYGRISAGASEFDGHTKNHHPFADERALPFRIGHPPTQRRIPAVELLGHDIDTTDPEVVGGGEVQTHRIVGADLEILGGLEEVRPKLRVIACQEHPDRTLVEVRFDIPELLEDQCRVGHCAQINRRQIVGSVGTVFDLKHQHHVTGGKETSVRYRHRVGERRGVGRQARVGVDHFVGGGRGERAVLSVAQTDPFFLKNDAPALSSPPNP